MMQIKQALFAKISADAPLQQRIGGQFYWGRLPLIPAPAVTRQQGAILGAGETTVVGGRGAKEEMTFTLTILTLSHDLAESIANDLDRLFHTRDVMIWRTLSLQGQVVGQARIRREFAGDVPEPGSELIRRVVRFRVLYAPAV